MSAGTSIAPVSARPGIGLRGVLDGALVVVAVGVLVLAVAWAFWPELFASASPYATAPSRRYQPPGGAFWFGSDHLGRDLYARVVYGAALSLQAAVIAVSIGLGAGTLVGLVSGYAGGRVDDVLMRLVDVSLALPGILLSLLIVTALGFGTINVAIAVGIGSVAGFARVMRAEVMRVRAAPYVEAASALGVRRAGVLGRHILPNSLGPVVALAPLEFGAAILSVATLGFLGYGARPPEPEWGSLVAEGRDYMRAAWWLPTLPGLVVIAVVLSANLLSRRLYRRFG